MPGPKRLLRAALSGGAQLLPTWTCLLPLASGVEISLQSSLTQRPHVRSLRSPLNNLLLLRLALSSLLPVLAPRLASWAISLPLPLVPVSAAVSLTLAVALP